MLLLVLFFTGRATSESVDTLSTRYQRGIHTDVWATGLSLDKNVFPRTRIVFSESFSSSRLQVLPGVNKWKDENMLNLDWYRRFRPSWTLQVKGSSVVFSDKQTGYMNDIQTHFIGAGAAYQKPTLALPLLIGLKTDRRYSRTDRGWSVQAGLDVPSFRFSGYTNRLNVLMEGDDLRRRKNGSLSLSYQVHRQFYADTRDSLSFSYRRQRRDYYISEVGDVESWDESGQNAENVLTYRMSKNLGIRVQGGLVYRTLNIRQITGAEKGFKRERKDFSASGSVRFAFRTASLFSDVGISAMSEEQNYRFAKSISYSPYSGGSYSIAPDNKSVWTTLVFNTRWNWSGSDTLLVHSSLQKLQYDTPDPANVDDRDDLRFWVNLQAIHAFSQDLSVRIAADVYLLHLVYLSGRKSADNNRTRIFRLHPSVRFCPSERVRLVQTAEVLANYVDYDFEDVLPGVRSFLYRKFRLDDSLRVGLSRTFTLLLAHRIELDENGKLVWNRWLEEKMLDRKSHTFSLEAAFSPMAGIVVAPGYAYYRRLGYRYMETPEAEPDTDHREQTQDFSSFGPTLRMFYKTDRLFWTLQISSMGIRNLSMPEQRTTRVDLTMNWQL